MAKTKQDTGDHGTSSASERAERTPQRSPKPSPNRSPWRWVRRLAITGLVLGFLGLLSGGAAVFWAFVTFGPGLPDHTELADYEPPVITRVHAADGSLLTEYSREPRLFVPIEAIPATLKQAVISAEDKNFFNHPGIDLLGIARAMVRNLRYLGQGRRQHGASTISQQVARIFLLSNEYSYARKIKEAILTLRIERALDKDRILELYLNEYYLGNGSYGVAAAALNYFNKPLNDLTTAEMAYIAGIFQGPAYFHPERNNARGKARRDWVLERMHVNGYIDEAEMLAAQATPLVSTEPEASDAFRADYFEETVRRRIADAYGSNALYEGGLSVRTTLEPRLQAIAERALRDGLIAYDRRHGWRGPVTQRSIQGDWAERLSKVPDSPGVEGWQMALVLELRQDGAVVGFKDGGLGFVPFETMGWAKRWQPGQELGEAPDDVADVLRVGYVVPVSPADGAPVPLPGFESLGQTVEAPRYALEQIPDIQGALVALDPHTGRVLAMVGGFDYGRSQFNRAVQAERQSGSAFKPFVYTAALEAGYTPASLILDEPFVYDQGPGQGVWKPRNYSKRFYGPSTLRTGLEKSRNLMTVRLAQAVGMDKVKDVAERFGVGARMDTNLAASLGSGEVTLMELTAGYGMFVNGGKRIEPKLVDRVQDRYGRTIERSDARTCPACNADSWSGQTPPDLPDPRDRILDPRRAYQVVSMLEGVVERGTGRSIRSLQRPLAGKTGTSDEAVDTWFIGFSPDLAVGVFVGFDQPRSLGPREQGASAAAPIFKAFMADALKGAPKKPFRRPPGIVLIQVDAETGEPVFGTGPGIITEAFLPGTEPEPGEREVLDGSATLVQSQSEAVKGTGGVY